MGEIRAYGARGFDALPVLIRPGIVGKQQALQMKSLNAQLWEIYENAATPTAFANKLCLRSASLSWGGPAPRSC